MDVVDRKMPGFRTKSLFVPRASVIRHTKEFKNPNLLSLFDSNRRSMSYVFSQSDQNMHAIMKNKEEKDSGIDSLSDEEENASDEANISNSFKNGILSGTSYNSEQLQKLTKSSDKKYVLLPPPLKFVPHPDATNPTAENNSRFAVVDNRLTEEQLEMDFEGSVKKHLLKEPQLTYLLQLYHYLDQGPLKHTLLKLVQNRCIADSAKKMAMMYMDKKNDEQENPTKSKKTTIDFSTLNDKVSYLDTKYQTDPEGRSGNGTCVFDNQGTSTVKSPSLVNNSKYISNNIPSNLFNCLSGSQVTLYENNLQCEYCHKKFNNEEAANRHLLTHKGKRTHKCTHCSRSFYEQSSYIRHLKSHSGEKAHKCDQCSMAFSKRSALEVHIRTHTGERPFLCKYCGKGFSISGNLHRHVLIHTGHRPYKCGKCPRAFNNPSHLARHISSFHA